MDLSFLEDLNERQREAVLAIEGPVMVIAGAGSGKTRVLTYRLAFVLSQGLADPQEMLALTFTNKAAREMKNRIHRIAGPEARGILMGTFHSIFARILRVEAEKIGYTRSFTIYDSDDSKAMVKKLLKEQGIDDKLFKPNAIANAISAAKTRLITPQKFSEHVQTEYDEKAALVYQLYEDRLRRANAMDFGDLLMKPVLMFQKQPELLHKYQHRFRYLMVDEYQDTNHVQYLLCRMLAAAYQNICVVGDDAQSIYAFRGANIGNILNFQRDYPEVQVVKLEQNYRSTQNIVNAANGIIAKNRDQIQKRVFTENEEGERIQLMLASSEHDEAQQVVDKIREQKQSLAFHNRDFAVLYRTNAQSRAIEDQLRRTNIPYRIYGGLSFYQRKEIKDLVAYLKLAINPRDEQALVRVINYPKRGVGKTSLQKMVIWADNNKLPLWEAVTNVDQLGLRGAAPRSIQEFATLIQSFQVVAHKDDAFEATQHIARESQLLTTLHTSGEPEDLARWENVQELLNAAKEFTDNPTVESPSLENFLAEISLFTDADAEDEDDNKVSLMTIHSAKGLEFPSVFVVGMEENLFPSSMAETRAELEEERRLFYVAATRAMKRLSLSYARRRYRYGQEVFNEPSRFLDEIDPQFVRLPGAGSRSAVSTDLSPASRRAASNPGSLGRKSTPRSATPIPTDFRIADPEEIEEGQTVRHLKFGVGKVTQIEQVGGQLKATVFFNTSGKKNLLLKYAKLMILS